MTTDAGDSKIQINNYVPTIDAILSVSDLEQITVKKIRTALQALFDVDLTPQKKDINDLIMSRYYKLVDELEKLGTQEEDIKESLKELAMKDEELAYKLQASLNNARLRTPSKVNKLLLQRNSGKVKKPRKPRDGSLNPTGFMKPLRLSPKLLLFLGKDESEMMPRTEVVKETWDYIKSHNLQNPNDKREILCDENMQPVFGKKQTMFSMNKVLKDHLFNIDE